MDEKSQTRERIIDAAVARMKHYGYAKTTMAEIAADCGMSPGNIYRFFEAKIDLAEAMARHHYEEEDRANAALVADASRPPLERIRVMLQARMRANYKMAEENAKILEVAEILARDRQAFMQWHLGEQRKLIAALLREGATQGSVDPHIDIDAAAEALQCATAKYAFPQLFTPQPLDELERELDQVLALVFKGLSARD